MNRPEARPPSRLSAPRRKKSTASLADGARLAAAAGRVDRAVLECPSPPPPIRAMKSKYQEGTLSMLTLEGDLFSDPLAYTNDDAGGLRAVKFAINREQSVATCEGATTGGHEGDWSSVARFRVWKGLLANAVC